MPNYEYRCISCENQFEIWQEVGSSPPPCPECGQEVKKIFHPVRTIFKGSGFYVTDLRAEKEKSSSPAKSESKTEAPAASSSDAKTETPAASKSDAKPDASPAPNASVAAAAPTKTG